MDLLILRRPRLAQQLQQLLQRRRQLLVLDLLQLILEIVFVELCCGCVLVI